EPSRGPRQAPSDSARIRRILRQPLSPERRRRAGNLLLSQRSGLQKEVRSARGDPQSCGRQRRTEGRGHRPLNVARMPTIDEELFAAATKFIDKSVSDKKPFFVWFCTTRMHIWTHLKQASDGVTGIGLYPDGMVEHDKMVGEMLKKLDDLGI